MAGWHAALITPKRVSRIVEAFASLVPPGTRSLLDVGTGDGLLATELKKRTSVETLEGVDVLVRPVTRIPVKAYDGLNLPHADHSFDLVTISDVLHHAKDPQRLLREAMRVVRPSGAVLIKDHFSDGLRASAVLLVMDVVGNAGAGIHHTGRYFTRRQWERTLASAGAKMDTLLWPFVVHDLPWRAIAKSEYQFVARLRPAER